MGNRTSVGLASHERSMSVCLLGGRMPQISRLNSPLLHSKKGSATKKDTHRSFISDKVGEGVVRKGFFRN